MNKLGLLLLVALAVLGYLFFDDIKNLVSSDKDATVDEITSVAPTAEEKTLPDVQEPYMPEDKTFSLGFPGEPTRTVQDVPTDLGTVKMTTLIYEADDNLGYMLAQSDYPTVFKDNEIDEKINGAKNGAISSFGINRTDIEKPIKLDNKYPGKYFTAHNNDYNLIYEVFLVKNRLYQIGVLSKDPIDREKDADVKKFFDSFRLWE